MWIVRMKDRPQAGDIVIYGVPNRLYLTLEPLMGDRKETNVCLIESPEFAFEVANDDIIVFLLGVSATRIPIMLWLAVLTENCKYIALPYRIAEHYRELIDEICHEAEILGKYVLIPLEKCVGRCIVPNKENCAIEWKCEGKTLSECIYEKINEILRSADYER